MALLPKIATAGAGVLGGLVGGAPGAAVAGGGMNKLLSGRPDALKPGKQAKEMLKEDVETLRNDPDKFGMTEGERQQVIGEATQQAGQEAQAQTAELQRAALAGTPEQQATLQDAAREIGEGTASASAEAAAGAADLHAAMVEREKTRVLGQLDAARQRAREDLKYWTQFGVNSLAGLMGAGGAAGEGGGTFSGAGTAPPAGEAVSGGGVA